MKETWKARKSGNERSHTEERGAVQRGVRGTVGIGEHVEIRAVVRHGELRVPHVHSPLGERGGTIVTKASQPDVVDLPVQITSWLGFEKQRMKGGGGGEEKEEEYSRSQ